MHMYKNCEIDVIHLVLSEYLGSFTRLRRSFGLLHFNFGVVAHERSTHVGCVYHSMILVRDKHYIPL